MVDRCLYSSTLCHPSQKLTNSRWEGHPATIRTTAFALCFSTAGHACSTKKDCNWMQQANTCMSEKRFFAGMYELECVTGMSEKRFFAGHLPHFPAVRAV